ncbi:MAG TPA: hypothetical protein VFT39_03750 [Vicinamibacterales bacterium]|nr:hypothetical protein [Vicinamibacterales bacterium]
MFSVLVVAGLLTVAVHASAAETACSSVTVIATFSSRTTLQVSSDLLQFDVVNADAPASASVDFVAAARTHAGGPVVLSIEPVRPMGSGGAAASLSFSGDGAGTKSGALSVDTPTVAGQWIGSGVRRGRLVFALRSTTPGNHVVPIRFVLSAP